MNGQIFPFCICKMFCHFFLITMVSDEKFKVIWIIFPIYVLGHFSLTICKIIIFLSSAFYNLIGILFCMNFFCFILFGVFSASWIYRYIWIFLPNLGKFLPLFFQYFFPTTHSLLSRILITEMLCYGPTNPKVRLFFNVFSLLFRISNVY